ncbi:hypothetical protein BC567DRAFT_98107 [Phyllosticta citribraziliensis]
MEDQVQQWTTRSSWPAKADVPSGGDKAGGGRGRLDQSGTAREAPPPCPESYPWLGSAHGRRWLQVPGDTSEHDGQAVRFDARWMDGCALPIAHPMVASRLPVTWPPPSSLPYSAVVALLTVSLSLCSLSRLSPSMLPSLASSPRRVGRCTTHLLLLKPRQWLPSDTALLTPLSLASSMALPCTSAAYATDMFQRGLRDHFQWTIGMGES